jgi:hypothetical protein
MTPPLMLPSVRPYIRKQDATTSANVTVTQQQQHHPPSASRGLKPATTPFCPPSQSIHGVMVVSKNKKYHANPCNLYTVARAPREASALAQVLLHSILPPRTSLLFNGIFSCLRCCHKCTHNVTVTQQQQHHLPSASRGLKPATTPFYPPFQSIHGFMVVSKKNMPPVQPVTPSPARRERLLRRFPLLRPGPAPLNPITRASLLFNGIFVSCLRGNLLFSLRRHRRRPL